VRLSVMTQKLAYDWITQLKELKPITEKRARKPEEPSGCPGRIRITQAYRAKFGERLETL